MICEAGNAPFGLRRSGLLSDLKPGKRFVLFHCGGEACAAEAAARLAAADAPTPSRPIRHEPWGGRQ